MRRVLRVTLTPDSVRSRTPRRDDHSSTPGRPRPSSAPVAKHGPPRPSMAPAAITPDTNRSRASSRDFPSTPRSPSQSSHDSGSLAPTIDYGDFRTPRDMPSQVPSPSPSLAQPSKRQRTEAQSSGPSPQSHGDPSVLLPEVQPTDSEEEEEEDDVEAWAAWLGELKDEGTTSFSSTHSGIFREADLQRTQGPPHDVEAVFAWLSLHGVNLETPALIGIEGSMARTHDILGRNL